MSKTGTENEEQSNNVYTKEDVNNIDYSDDDKLEDISESLSDTIPENNIESDIHSDSDNDDEFADCPQRYADSLYNGTDVNYNDLDNNDTQTKIVHPNKRITKAILYKYEYVSLLGTRARNIAGGAKPMIKNSKHLTPKEIANLEIKYDRLPLKLLRPLPDGTIELWKMKELDKNNIFK